jgi:uncharacterized protein
MHCCDDQGRPLLAPQPRKDGEPGDLSNAHLGIPAAVEALHQYWMPIRYKREWLVRLHDGVFCL